MIIKWSSGISASDSLTYIYNLDYGDIVYVCVCMNYVYTIQLAAIQQ